MVFIDVLQLAIEEVYVLSELGDLEFELGILELLFLQVWAQLVALEL